MAPPPELPDDPEEAARQLLGSILHTRIGTHRTAVALTEVEAYGGGDDPASHAWRGRTNRNASMFLGPGHLYVYRIHQVVCANVVVGPGEQPGAVLLRGGQPVDGKELMVRRRGRTDHLADGPGKLCQAMGITIAHDGLLLGEQAGIWLERGDPPARVDATPRIGISRATERRWRFVGVREASTPTG